MDILPSDFPMKFRLASAKASLTVLSLLITVSLDCTEAVRDSSPFPTVKKHISNHKCNCNREFKWMLS